MGKNYETEDAVIFPRRRITRDDVMEIAEGNATIFLALAKYRAGEMDYEEAMMTAVFVLARESDKLKTALEDCYKGNRKPPAMQVFHNR